MRDILINHENLLSQDAIINFELSRREVIEKSGNWATDLNGGDDVEYMARMGKTGIRRLGIPAVLSADINVMNGKKKGRTVINEYRYDKGLKYLRRMSENLINTVRGYGLYYSDLNLYSDIQKIGILYGIAMVKVMGLNLYRHFEDVNNLEAAASAIEYLNPEIFSIPKNRWVSTISPHVHRGTIKSKIEKLSNFGYKYIYENTHIIIVSYLPLKDPYDFPHKVVLGQ